MHKFVKFGDHDVLHYLEFGKGTPVVLVPSLWVTSKSYRALGQELGRFYRVFIPDIFRGRSEFPRLATRAELSRQNIFYEII